MRNENKKENETKVKLNGNVKGSKAKSKNEEMRCETLASLFKIGVSLHNEELLTAFRRRFQNKYISIFPVQTANGPRTDPERTPNGSRTDPERTPNGPRTDPVCTSNGSRTDPNGSRTDPERTPNGPWRGDPLPA